MQDASESKWLIFSACSLLLFLMNFDMSGVNLALAPITVDLKLSIVDVQWIISAYMIGGAAFVLLGGVLGDRFGYRRIFSIGTFGLTRMCTKEWRETKCLPIFGKTSTTSERWIP